MGDIDGKWNCRNCNFLDGLLQRAWKREYFLMVVLAISIMLHWVL